MDDERTFQWFTPRKRRATMYEDVTMDTQPSVHRFLERGWQMCFDDGAPTWSDDSTASIATELVRLPGPGRAVGAALLPARRRLASGRSRAP